MSPLFAVDYRTYSPKNWVRKIARVTRADRRRMVELREETGMQRSLTERLVRSRLQWAGHVERMADERLPKRAAELREHGSSAGSILDILYRDTCERSISILAFYLVVSRYFDISN